MSLISNETASIDAPIVSGIERCFFQSPFDGSAQTFLVKDFRLLEAGSQLGVVFLHGAISHEDQGMTAGIYDDAFGKWAKELAQRHAVYICPEYRGGSWMAPAAESDLLEILRLARKIYSLGKIVLIGGSMGGTSALIFASRHDTEIDGVIALSPASDIEEMYLSFPEQLRISYEGSPAENPEEYRSRSVRNSPGRIPFVPTVIVHGTADMVIPIHHSRLLVQQLEKHRTRLHYIEIEGGDHDTSMTKPLAPLLDFVLTIS